MFKCIIPILFLFISCGSDVRYKDDGGSYPPDGGGGGGGGGDGGGGGSALSFNQVKSILQSDCGGCHPNAVSSGFLSSEAAVKRNGVVKNKISNRLMPPPAAPQMNKAEREAVLVFLEN